MEAVKEAISNYKYYADLYDQYGDSQDLRLRNRWGKSLIKELQNNVNTTTRYKISYKSNGVQKGIMLTPKSIDKFRDKILTGMELHREFDTGSDVIDLFDIHDIDPDIEVEEIELPNKNNDGYYFKYYNTTQFDLSKYQIYTKEQKEQYLKNQETEINEHCLWLALYQSKKLTEDQLCELKLMLVEGNCPKSRLKPIAEKLNIQITLTEYLITTDKISLKYINKGNRENISIALYKDHYFINDIISIHLFGARNWNNKQFTSNKRFSEIIRFREQDKYIEYKKEYSQKALTIIKEIFENKGFEEFKFEDHYKDINFEMNYKQDIKLIETDISKDEINREPKKIKYNKNIYFADFETTTQGLHKAHTIAWYEVDGLFKKEKINSLIGDNCVIEFLEKVKQNSTVYFHNLKYDWQQIFDKVFITKAIEKDGQLYKMQVQYFGKSITFMDSYKMISEPLRNFPSMFNLKSFKDIMPYELYTQENIKEFDVTIDEALKYIKEEDKQQFIINIKENNFENSNGRFRHMEYSRFYCKKDVELLAEGFIMFRNSTLDKLEVDVYNYTSISSLADDYLVKEGCYEGVRKLEGTIRAFVQQSVIGGRVVTKDHKKWHLKENIQDFDAVALYPTAMNRIDGFPTGHPKIIKNSLYEEIKDYDNYVVEILITSQDKKEYGIPMMTYYDSQLHKRIWSNDMLGVQTIVDKITLEDYIKYYNIKFDIIKGVYWNEGINNKVCDVIKNLFENRKKYKEEKNPIQIVYKLLMNSAYGKTIMKESREQIRYIYDTKDKPNSTKDFEIKNYNLIKGYEVINHNKLKCVKYYIYKNKFDHENYGHLGTLILSMSKRIMNEINNIANENEIPIYYVDTDSMHLPENKIELLECKFKEKYNRELIGKNMGQFHSDFNSNKIKGNIKAVETIILGPKVYYDLLEGDNGIQDNHIRLKGISLNSIVETAKLHNKSIKDLYIDLYEGKEISFDLVLGGVKMEYVNGGVINRKSFIRKIKF